MAHHPDEIWETVEVNNIFSMRCTAAKRTITLPSTNNNAVFLRAHMDRLAAAVREHNVSVVIETDICSMDPDRILNIESLNAYAEFHEALLQPIKANVQVDLSTIVRMTRSLPMVHQLHIEQHSRGGDNAKEANFLRIVRLFPNLVHLDLVGAETYQLPSRTMSWKH